ncbi:MAG: hypothetical protein IKQ41_07425 [Clostridia bacterium]|nr:hypothetical protein [Clostridia bacterium]
MRAVTVMFDALNRHLLSPYGCRETVTPNSDRLAGKWSRIRKPTARRYTICCMVPPPRHPLRDEALLGAFEEALSRLMQQEDAPGKPWLRLGLSRQ